MYTVAYAVSIFGKGRVLVACQELLVSVLEYEELTQLLAPVPTLAPIDSEVPDVQ